ncbi:hypothetical protein GUJ93_ZPchr0011g28831 [Zizania palustris]|uniref:Uncharacterized protein n=1 Tax=Zizania palustris TaxID=103762 RepID=A0A8J5WLA4_ZIZPA|nr:hypothetical protein GUJ93_ZPchr0011g28831 [Zizania palustris]
MTRPSHSKESVKAPIHPPLVAIPIPQEGDFEGDGWFAASELGSSGRLDDRQAGSSVTKAAKGSRLDLGSR